MSSPPTNPRSPSPSSARPASPARSFKSRMGTMMRRTSTGLAFTKSGSLSRSASKTNLKVDAAQASSSSQDSHPAPSPVAESPAREAAAANEVAASGPLGPSPLSRSTLIPTEPTPQPSPAMAEQTLVAEPEPKMPEPEPAPAPTPAPAPAPVPARASTASLEQPSVASENESRMEHDFHIPRMDSPEPLPLTSSPPQMHEELPTMPEPEPAPAPAPASAPPQPIAEKLEDRRPDYFSWSDDHTLAPNWSAPDLPAPAGPPPAVAARVSEAPSPASSETARAAPTDAQTFAWRGNFGVVSKGSIESLDTRDSVAGRPIRSGRISSRASRSSLASSYGHALDTTVISLNDDSRRGRSSSIRMPVEDPFADPATHLVAQHMPMPMGLSPVQSIPDMPPNDVHSPTHLEPYTETIAYALPPAHDVIASKSSRPVSGYNLENMEYTELHDNNERSPLLQNAANPAKVVVYEQAVDAAIPPDPRDLVSSPNLTFHNRGWKEYTLPDSTLYYAHAGMSVTTDIDLRNAMKLTAVIYYLDKKQREESWMPPPGWELWLTDGGSDRKRNFVTKPAWVNHQKHILLKQFPKIINGEVVLDGTSEDDKLDIEYRYFCYLEAHSAHISLPAETRAEAIDALTWSYTDSLLPSERPVPPPFSPQECQELMALLRTSESETGGSSFVQARLVARVLVRKVQWRQYYFRPRKPLPNDVMKRSILPTPYKPFGRTILEFFVSCLCLGIPYLFLERSHHTRIDPESGLRSAGPMLMVGACACLVAAIILSASVTFISLPGLDDIARVAGLVAILFSASSMISSVIAMFRYKADMERTVVYMGGEGLVMLSRRSVIMSLPLVFLAWAIAAFMTGITFYSFRGATLGGKTRYPFEDYTHWAVVGTMGGLGSILIICALLARR